MIEVANKVANEAVKEVAKEKPVTQAEKIRNFVAEHPFTKANTIAKKMGIDRQYVYTVMWSMKNKTKLASKKKAMTNKELVDLTPALKFVEGRAKAQRENWKQLGLFSSNTSIHDLKVGSEVGGLILTEVGNGKLRWVKGQNPQIEMFEPKPDAVNHPAHYKVGGIETIDFIEAKKLGYNLGNVVKYLTRANHKGNKLEDLRKAQWYLEREINSQP